MTNDEIHARLDALGVGTTTDLRSVLKELDHETIVALAYGPSDHPSPRKALHLPSEDERKLCELWEQHAAEIGFGPDEEYLIFGRGIEHDAADWPIREALGEDVNLHDAESRGHYDEMYGIALERVRSRVSTLKDELREAEKRARPATAIARRRPCISVARAPRARRVARPGTRARSPGRSTGEDPEPPRPHLDHPAEAGS